MTSKKKSGWLPSPLASFTAFIYLFLYAPIVVLIIFSFNRSRFASVWRGFTWEWYAQAWKDVSLISSLRMSLMVAFLTTIVSVAIGTAAAIALARYRIKLRQAAETLIMLPVIIPEIVIGFATAALFGLAGVAFGLTTIIAAHVAFSISYVVFLVRARLVSLSSSFEEAAMDLGATRWQTFVHVTLPLILPAIISAALLVFTLSLDDYVITSFVAGPGATTLPMKIYSMIKTGVTPEINAISSVLLVTTILLVFVSERLTAGRLSRRAIGVAAVALLALVGFSLGGSGRKQLNIYIWSDYLPEEVIAEFEHRFDAKVNVEFFDSDEALLSKLQAGGASYDIVVPSNSIVTILREQGLIQPINLNLIPNFENLDPQFVGLPYDPENQYSIPYMWGTSGIAYRKDKVAGPIDSWAAMWDPRYKDHIAMLNDVRETFGAALKWMGKSLNSADPDEIAEAARLLMRQRSLVLAYDSDTFEDLLLNGEAWIVQGFSGDIARVMSEDPNIGYVIPKEGCTIFVDNLCIPVNAGHVELAHEFINFVLEAKTAAAIANGTGFPSPNLAAREFIRPDLLANEAAYPPKEAIGRCEFIKELGEAISIYDRYWTEIKSE
ncbi:MAG TPA: extracellular solute-binding protein [Blastocatellia bacterium]|nr:extracellular solute-binding protein [Blastocatellia bacterium]